LQLSVNVGYAGQLTARVAKCLVNVTTDRILVASCKVRIVGVEALDTGG
jgi:hypothetical protein